MRERGSEDNEVGGRKVTLIIMEETKKMSHEKGGKKPRKRD